MHELAPRAIGLGLGFARTAQKASAEHGSLIIGAVRLGPMLIAPVHGQDFAERIALRVAAGAVRDGQIGSLVDITHETAGRRNKSSACPPYPARQHLECQSYA